MSTLPVDWQNAVTSGTEPGSVDSTSSLAPIGSSDSALRVFRIGSGQVKPLVSSVLSGIRGLRANVCSAYISEAKALATTQPRRRQPHRRARAMAAGHDAYSRPVWRWQPSRLRWALWSSELLGLSHTSWLAWLVSLDRGKFVSSLPRT